MDATAISNNNNNNPSSPSSSEREREREDDGAISVTSLLAKEAFALFQSDKFSDCLDVLLRLSQKKEADPKIQHNIAVTEFLRDGCSDPKKLIDVLVSAKKKSEDLARASREQTDGGSQNGNKAILGAKGMNNLTNSSGVFTDQFDASVAALNIATVLYHLHEYSKASSVLELLFQNIAPINEITALHVCLLLLDIAFTTQDAFKFSDVVNYLEKAFGGSMLNQAESGNMGSQQASTLVPKPSSMPNNSSSVDDLNSDGTMPGNASEVSLSRTLSDETIEYETLLSTLDISGNLSRPPNLSSANDLLRGPADRSAPTINLKLQFPLYKIQLLLLTRNLKAAKREVKQAMNIGRGVDSSRTLLLKSQLEYARGNYPKAIKLLRASSNQPDISSSIIINNNIGCIYYQQGKRHMSGIFFHKALSNCSSLWKEKPRKLTTFSQDKSLLIAYNCGVQYLACGKPILAARCFLKASLVLYNRSLLWLRLAECCLIALEKGLTEHIANCIQGSEVRVQVIGQGKWRQLAVETGSLRNANGSSIEKDDTALDASVKPKLSMSFARQCLLNALHLLGSHELKCVKSGFQAEFSPDDDSEDAALSKNLGHKTSSAHDPLSKDSTNSGSVISNGDAKGGSHVNAAAANAMSEYEEISRRENQKIKQAILTDLAFVELELGNPVMALSVALSLLKLPECSGMYTFLAHIYAAEALCLLNRPMEAAEHLSRYVSGGSNVELPYTEEDCRQWQAKKVVDSDDSNTGLTTARVTPSDEPQDCIFLSPEEARGALYINLASMYVMRGNFEQACKFAAQAFASAPNNQEAALMLVFLDLKLGNTQEALARLKKCCRVRFLPFSSRSKSAS